MKQLRWKDFSLVSKIVIEVGMIAVLLFAMNMLFYVPVSYTHLTLPTTPYV